MEAFEQYDFEGDERWVTYRENLLVPSHVDRDAVLRKKKLQFYKRFVDPAFEPPGAQREQAAAEEAPRAGGAEAPQHAHAESASAGAGAGAGADQQRSPLHKTLMRQLTYAQLVGHVLVLLLTALTFLPFVSPFHPHLVFYRAAQLGAVLQAVALLRTHGRPRSDRMYFFRLLMDEESHYFMYAVIVQSCPPGFLPLLPFAGRSLVFVIRAVDKILAKYAPATRERLDPRIRGWNARIPDILHFSATMEIYEGVLLIVQIFTGEGGFLSVFVFWQFLRVHYMIAPTSQYAFATLRRQLDSLLLGERSWCPRPVATLWVKLCSFLHSMADLESQMRAHREQQAAGGGGGLSRFCAVM
jgi:hypothetical protein